ncbi:MAG: hypothetical protein RIQ41_288 [Candidatus Parcubacteria bacterium]|jgi:hypothetical protein
MYSPFSRRYVIVGFTLIELVVSMGILFLLAAILLANYPETAVRLTLANTTQKLSLMVREAQIRGSAVDSVNSSLGGYGVFISLASPTSFLLFGDTVDPDLPKPYGISIGNKLFESGNPINETKSITTLPSRYSISRICVGTGFPFTCTTDNDPEVETLTVSFMRPSPTPYIYINGTTTVNFAGACIELRSPQAPAFGHIRNVQVFSSGMIRSDIGKCDNSQL